ncbi:MAG: hypothetical protein ACP6IT_06110 [Candidatus Thorarchaeota archaeon]
MPSPDEYYAANVIPPVAWALELYLKHKGRFKEQQVLEISFPAGFHKEMMRKKGPHEIAVWTSEKKIWVRARCTYSKECSFNSERIDGSDREAVKLLPWGEIDSRKFFPAIRKWLLRMDLDFVLFIRALNTICDRRVELPLTTQFGKTFKKFDEYRRTRWPEDVTPEKRDKFLEQVLLRVAFWFQTAAIVGALK